MVFCRPLIPAMIAAMVAIGFSQQAEAAHLVGGTDHLRLYRKQQLQYCLGQSTGTAILKALSWTL